MKTRLILLLSLIFAFSAPVYAAEKVITQDGREILLQDDGSWRFLSNDRYANTIDGRRVRLKDDNTWEYIGNAPLKTEQRVRNETTDIQLNKVEIESLEEKSHKNKRVITHTVFYLDVTLSPLAKQTASLTSAARSLISVTDNHNNHYPVLTVTPTSMSLKPGESYRLIIRTDGSAQWWSGIKTMQLTIEPGFFDNKKPIELTYRVSDIDRVLVEELPEKPDH